MAEYLLIEPNCLIANSVCLVTKNIAVCIKFPVSQNFTFFYFHNNISHNFTLYGTYEISEVKHREELKQFIRFYIKLSRVPLRNTLY